MMQNFHNKIAVLTGGASGFGFECARLAVGLGMKVVLVDVQADALARAQAELQEQSHGSQIWSRRVDVADGKAMQALADFVRTDVGIPHIVFNNAGVGAGGLIWENTVADWEWLLGVNLWGVIHGVRLFTPLMLAQAQIDPDYRGHIVNTASMAGLLTAPNMGIYNATKHAVVALTETLYQDLHLVTQQVSASVLCPYFVPTGIIHSERNRPTDLAAVAPSASQLIGQAMSVKAVSSGKVSAAEVAQMVFDAIAQDRFYIFSHPKALGNVQQRMEAIVQMQQPPDPFATRPEVGETLRRALRS